MALVCLMMLLAGGCSSSTSSSGTGLRADDLKMAAEKNGANRGDHKFKKGEVVWLQFKVMGFKQADDGNVWVQQDLDVTAPDGKNILHKDNILDFHQVAPKGADSVDASNDITLPPGAPSGEYKVSIALRDKVWGGNATSNFSFTVE
jgi:hypothetical protein